MKAQTNANTRQAELNDRELKAIASLVEKGYAPRPRLTEMQTRESQLVGAAGELASRKAKAEQAKAAAELEILSLEPISSSRSRQKFRPRSWNLPIRSSA